MNELRRLVVIPSNPIEAFERKGIASWLESYYNPTKFFDEVYALSPYETQERQAYGMQIVPSSWEGYADELRALRPDLVRAYGGFWTAELAAANRIPGVPVVVSVHDVSRDQKFEAVSLADAVFCTTKLVQQLVVERGCHVSKTRILPNRVDLQLFRCRQPDETMQQIRARFPEGRFVLHIGRKTQEKNVDTVVRALAKLPAEYHAVFVGAGDAGSYKDLAQQQGVHSRCFWIDSVPNDQLPWWYSWCDCFCVPSRREGFGLVFIEAAACGAPIVTSNIAPMNDFFTAGQTATLVDDYQEAESVAAAIRKICEDAQYRQVVTRQARDAALPFDKESIDRLEAQYYAEVLSGRLGRAPSRLGMARWRVKRRLRTVPGLARYFLRKLRNLLRAADAS